MRSATRRPCPADMPFPFLLGGVWVRPPPRGRYMLPTTPCPSTGINPEQPSWAALEICLGCLRVEDGTEECPVLRCDVAIEVDSECDLDVTVELDDVVQLPVPLLEGCCVEQG